jgi:hypothetical protein
MIVASTYARARALVPHQCPESVLALPDVVVLRLLGDFDAVGRSEEDWFQHPHGLIDLTRGFVSVRAKQ